MGFFNRTSTAPTTIDNLPAAANHVAGRITAGGKDLATKATQIYKDNPKLVGGIALVASAILLNKLRGTRKRLSRPADGRLRAAVFLASGK